MNAVINSTPLITLTLLGRLDILGKLYTEIYVPECVYREVFVQGAEKQGKHTFESISPLKLCKIQNDNLKRSIMVQLDEGEAEVITYAKDSGITNVIIDEFAGREYAKLLNLKVTGTIGLLIISKELGFIEKVKPYLDIMIANKRYIEKNLYNNILRSINESE